MKPNPFKFLILLFAFAIFSPPATADPVRDCIIEASYEVIGETEVSHNSSPVIDKMLETVHFEPGAAWCGAAVAYNYAQCLPIAQLEAFLPMKKWAYTPYTYNQAKALNLIIYQSGKYTLSKYRKPDKADQFWIYNNRLGRVSHTGIIDNWHPYGRMAITLEGNTNIAGSREGDGFYVMYRDKRQIYAVGDVISYIS